MVYKMITAVRTENLTKFYNDNIVVDHLNFHIKKGEIVSLLGPNGAGKSTTIRMLATLLIPDEGTAFINGYDIRKNQNAVKNSIGLTPQELVFYEELTALENLIFFGTMQGIPKERLKQESTSILATLDLLKRKDKVKNFSGGMKRRLNLAISLILNPEVLFLDEPTAGLDPQSQHVVWELLQTRKNEGKTIILTTHDMYEAEILSDRVFIIDNGKVIAEGTPNVLKERYSNKNILEIIFKDDLTSKGVTEKISTLNYVMKVASDPNRITVFFNGGIISLIKILKQQIIEDVADIESMSLRQATLEDVFLELTGRKLQ
jgi:ABC-2 type transport system ATP-binding protein